MAVWEELLVSFRVKRTSAGTCATVAVLAVASRVRCIIWPGL